MSEPEAALIGAASPASEGGTAPTRRGGCGLDLGSVHRFREARDCWLLWRQWLHTAERQAVHVHRLHGTRPGLEPTSSGSIPVRVSTPFGLDAHECMHAPPAAEAASERQRNAPDLSWRSAPAHPVQRASAREREKNTRTHEHTHGSILMRNLPGGPAVITS